MTAAASLAAPSRAERLSAVLCGVRRLRPTAAARGVSSDARVCWELLAVALDCALRLAGMGFVTPLGAQHGGATVPRTIGEAHAEWARVSVEILDAMHGEARGHARARSTAAEHLLALRDEWRTLARRVDRLFEALTEGRL